MQELTAEDRHKLERVMNTQARLRIIRSMTPYPREVERCKRVQKLIDELVIEFRRGYEEYVLYSK
jgi:hypothetical protein